MGIAMLKMELISARSITIHVEGHLQQQVLPHLSLAENPAILILPWEESGTMPQQTWLMLKVSSLSLIKSKIHSLFLVGSSSIPALCDLRIGKCCATDRPWADLCKRLFQVKLD